MKWTRKKKSPSLISRVFPVSWFSRFTHKRGDRDADTAQLSNDAAAALDLPPPIPCRKGRFYSMDENDAFWRISFGEDNRIPPRRSCGAAVERDLGNPNLPDFKHLRLGEDGEVSTKGEFRNFSEMVSDVKKMREKEKAKQVRDSRQILPVETKTKSEPSKRRESSKGYNCNFKAYSPRTEFKIRALEEMKRSRTRRARKERVDSVFDSFAVVKSSVDPQRDFKDSMVEMIREKGIRHEDELEQLLACYLTLNCDEYHDLIIGVFRQVWIEQKRLC